MSSTTSELDEPGADLVHEQDAGLERQRSGQLEPLELQQRQVLGLDGAPRTTGRGRAGSPRSPSGCHRPPVNDRRSSARRAGSRAPSSGGNGLGIWWVRPMPIRARLYAGRCVTSTPSYSTVPPSACRAPLSMPTKVLLPAPLGPMTPSTSPRRTSRSTSDTATTSPNRLVMPAARRRACPRSPAAPLGEIGELRVASQTCDVRVSVLG